MLHGTLVWLLHFSSCGGTEGLMGQYIKVPVDFLRLFLSYSHVTQDHAVQATSVFIVNLKTSINHWQVVHKCDCSLFITRLWETRH